jgi:hypothetical protein
MSGSTLTPLKTAYSRVFLLEGRARPDHQPSYEYSLRAQAASQGFGDVTAIENPKKYRYGEFDEIGETQAGTERVTTTLEGRYARDLQSELLRLARKRCAIDVQLHMGACQDPSDFNKFDKVLVFEKASLTSYDTEDLGALQSDQEAAVNESVGISAREMYEILPITFGEKAGSIVTNEILDMVFCDVESCGDCEDESDGCAKVYGISSAAGGSPSTPADLVFSLDGGVTWYAHDIDTLGASDDPSGVDCVSSYVVVVSNASASLHYVLKSAVDALGDPAFTEVTTGIVSGGEPNAIFSLGSVGFIAGDAGYIYKVTDPTAGVTVLDAGSATISVLNDIHAISEDVIVAVGNDGSVVYTENGETFAAATSPVGVGVDLNCVFVKNDTEWWVGTSGGQVFYTLDGGATWTEKAFTGSGSGVVRDIQFSTDSVAWIAHDTSAPLGRVLRSYDGGYQWQVVPEREGASMPLNDRINALAVCSFDPNLVIGGGLADNGSDGFIVVGKD